MIGEDEKDKKGQAWPESDLEREIEQRPPPFGKKKGGEGGIFDSSRNGERLRFRQVARKGATKIAAAKGSVAWRRCHDSPEQRENHEVTNKSWPSEPAPMACATIESLLLVAEPGIHPINQGEGQGGGRERSTPRLGPPFSCR